MKRITLILAALLPSLGFGQVSGLLSVNQTSLASAVAISDLQVSLSANFTAASPLGAVAVANGIVLPSVAANGSLLYVVDPGSIKGEVMQVTSLVSTGVYKVKRGIAGSKQTKHISGAMILVGPPNAFISSDPQGACSATSVDAASQVLVNLSVNISTGAEWICSTVSNTWVPGFNNAAADAFTPTAAVASAAGLITPSGPLFHITGALAITGFNLPLGFNGGTLTVIADGAFTWTAANNIALASSAAVTASHVYTFIYDTNTSKFYASPLQ